LIVEDGFLAMLHAVFPRILLQPFAFDTWINDDTARTNFFDLRLFAVIVVDCNFCSELLGYSFMPNVCEYSFTEFFQFLSTHSSNTPRVIVCDRHAAQIASVRHFYPNAAIIWCQKHLAANIKEHLGKEFKDDFWKCMKGEMEEQTFLGNLQHKLNEFHEQASHRHITFIETLLNNQNSWLPSLVYPCSFTHTTQRVEGFCGNVKDSLQGNPDTLSQLFSTLHNHYKNLLLNSLRLSRSCNCQSLFTEGDAKKIGNYPLEKI
jgi:hypothetical protein